MTSSTLTPAVRDTLRSMLFSSLGTTMYQRLYVRDGKRKKDVMKKGELSCAFYVSSILATLGLIDAGHATVRSTEKCMMKKGWKSAKKFAFGDVLIWGASKDSHGHEHIGFYIGNNKAISNNAKKRVPVIHHYTYRGARPVARAYRHPLLAQ